MNSNHASSSLGKIVLLVVCLPLFFAAFGGWQFSRAWDPELSATREKYTSAIAEVESIIAEEGASAQVRVGKRTRTASAYLRELRADKASLEEHAVYTDIKTAAAGTVVVLGTLAALIGVAGLLTIRGLGKKALESRDALLRGFQSGMKKIPWLIGGVGFLTAGALALGIAYEVFNFALYGISGRGSGKVVIFGIVAVVFLLVYAFRLIWKIFQASRAVFERDPMQLMGKSVSREESPGVWSFVKEVADRAGAAMPDGIVLGLDEGFFVTEHPVTLRNGMPVPAGRILYLPLPYMAFMSKNEAAAVIGHELGHFTGADTEYSLHFSPIYAGAVGNLRAVASASEDDSGIMSFVAKPSSMMGEFFLDSFDLAVQHWSREREFAADQMGASVANNEAIALSLLRISVLAPHIYRALGECWEQGGKLEGGVLARVRELVRTEGLDDPMEHLEETMAHPTDSHPPMRQRLEAVGVAATSSLLEKARCTEDSGLLRELGIEGESVRESAPLSSALEAEFSKVAKDNADSITAELKETAAQGREELSFYEGGILIFVIWGLIILTAFSVSAAMGEDPRFRYGALAVGVAFLGFMIYRYRMRAKPFITLTINGILLPGQETVIPWAAVEDYGITVNSTNGITTNVVTTLDIAEGHDLPAGRPDRRVKCSVKKRRITITILNLRGRMNADKFSEVLGTYWRGGVARARLYEMRYGNV